MLTPIPHIWRYAETPSKGVEPSILLQTTVFRTASHRWGTWQIHILIEHGSQVSF